MPDAKRVLLTAYADTDAAIDGDQRGADRLLPHEAVGSARADSTPSLDDLLDDWQAGFDGRPSTASASSATAGRPSPTSCAISSAATWSRSSGSTSTSRPRRATSSSTLPATARHRRCRSSSFPRATVLEATRSRRRSPRASACARAPRSRSTISSSSAADRRASPPPSTARPRDCARCSSSARRRWAGRHELAHRELPRLPERAQRRGPRAARGDAGAQVRRRDPHAAGSVPARASTASTASSRSPTAAEVSHARAAGRVRRLVPHASTCRARRPSPGRGIYYGASLIEARLVQ